MKSTLPVMAIALSLVAPLRAQDATVRHAVTKDWITHHVVFSNPGTKEDAIKNGTFDRWLRIVNDPRYIMQQEDRNRMASAAPSAASDVVTEDDADDDSQPPAQPYNGPLPHGIARAAITPSPDLAPAKKLPSHNRLKKDWSETLGSLGTTGLGEFPATFTAGSSPSCTGDFAIYNTGLAGSGTQASVVAYTNLYSTTCNGGTTQNPAPPTITWAYNTNGGAIVNSIAFDAVPNQTNETGTQGYFVQTVGGAAQLVLLKWTAGTGTLTSPTALTTTPRTVSSGVHTTLGSTALTNGSGFTTAEVGAAITGTDIAPGTTIAAYVSASAVTLSLPATGTSTTGNFTVGDFSATVVTPSTYYSGCTPCMTTLFLNGGPTDTYSAPYYDPTSDTIYVGDDAGKLHQFTPVFNGPLAEVTTGGWPATVNANASLGSPVYYNATGTSNTSAVLVGDYPYNYASNCQPNVTTSNSPCGFLYSVTSAGTGGVTASHQLDYNNGIIDSPILDSTTGKVYVFVGQDNNGSPTGTATTCNVSGGAVVPCAAVYQFAVGFAANAPGAEAQVGPGSQFMMSGTFDNAYFTTGTGHLYAVGNTGPADNTLYQIGVSSSSFPGTITAGPEVATNYDNGYYAAGLQVTEYYNSTGNDFIFLSTLAFGNGTGCTSQSLTVGCVMGFNLTTETFNGSMAVTGALPEAGGTSGIVVDYAGASGGIYFTTLLNQSCTTSGGTGGCATQTSQSAP